MTYSRANDFQISYRTPTQRTATLIDLAMLNQRLNLGGRVDFG